MGIPVGRVLKYSLLPGIIPRTVDFVSSGFSHIAVFIACVFCTVRLLPPSHPYLNPANTGRFGIRHVLGEARKNLVFDKRNIDQVLIYYIILLGFAIIFLQILLLVAALTVKIALAGPPATVGDWWRMFFTRPNIFTFGGVPVAN